MDDRKEVILRTYKNVWKFERQIYSIEGIKLLIPVKPNEVLYFIVSIALTLILVTVIPFANRLPFAIKYLFVPFGIMKFLTKQKLDGKLPHKFFYDFIVYKLSSKRFEKFRAVNELKKDIRFVTTTTIKPTVIFNKTEEALRNKGNPNHSDAKAVNKAFGRRKGNV